MYKVIKSIKSGKFGSVFLVENESGHKFAAKLFRNKNSKESELSSSAELEVSNFNSFSTKVKDIGKASLISSSSITGLPESLSAKNFNETAMLMPFFQKESEPNYSEIKIYISDLADEDVFMGDPKPDNFFHTSKYGLIPIDFGLVFHKNSPNLSVKYKNALANAPFDYPDAFDNAYTGKVAKKYQGVGVVQSSQLNDLIHIVESDSDSKELLLGASHDKSEETLLFYKTASENKKKSANSCFECCTIL
ncbi:hypothetical protein [Piscirickettsia litoralis]|uniref:Protein kinase domain-containing protein n=1 Tax=Piscirickettsia litoralis TaxID=1891921 RepID=A0ABX2ZZP5_9GAMM|nr:hypothetical protein [Piscirickettsia litoralis]ODN41703.1 hypothetical protein BGC07_00280 [Piscirickettsia litoralis]